MRLGRAITLFLLGGIAAVLGPGLGSEPPVNPLEPALVPVASDETAVEPAAGPLLGPAARGRVARHTAVVTARLVAGGIPQGDAEAEAFRLLEPTGCGEHTRFFIVPRGFVDGRAIEDRISIESSYYEAEVTEAADSPIPLGTRFAPQFSRIISVVFLFDCPAMRA